MYLKSIEMTNLQAISHYVIELPETGLVRFSGKNSNGKSILRKVLVKTLNKQITKPDYRHSLINKNSTFGELKLTKDNGDYLLIHLERPSAQCFIELSTNGNIVKRGMQDKPIHLVHEFGFHYNEKYDMPLQLFSPGDPQLYVTTSRSMNAAFLNSSLVDERATTAYDTMTEYVKTINTSLQGAVQKYHALEMVLENLVFWNVDKCKTVLQNLERIRQVVGKIHYPTITDLVDASDVPIIDHIYTPSLPDVMEYREHTLLIMHSPKLPDVLEYREFELLSVYSPSLPNVIPVPDVNPIVVYKPVVENITMPTVISLHEPVLEDVGKQAIDLYKLSQMKCPTCGQSLVGEEHIHES